MNEEEKKELRKLMFNPDVYSGVLETVFKWIDGKKKEWEDKAYKKAIDDIDINSTKLIGSVKKRYKEIQKDRWDYSSFYNGWIEGRFDLFLDIKGERPIPKGKVDKIYTVVCTKCGAKYPQGIKGNCPKCNGELFGYRKVDKTYPETKEEIKTLWGVGHSEEDYRIVDKINEIGEVVNKQQKSINWLEKEVNDILKPEDD